MKITSLQQKFLFKNDVKHSFMLVWRRQLNIEKKLSQLVSSLYPLFFKLNMCFCATILWNDYVLLVLIGFYFLLGIYIFNFKKKDHIILEQSPSQQNNHKKLKRPSSIT